MKTYGHTTVIECLHCRMTCRNCIFITIFLHLVVKLPHNFRKKGSKKVFCSVCSIPKPTLKILLRYSHKLMRLWPYLNETWNLAHFSHKLTSMWIRDGDILQSFLRYCCEKFRKRKAHMQSSIINTLSMAVECFCSLKLFVWHHYKRCELKTLRFIHVEWFEYFMLIQRATKVQGKVQGNSEHSNFPWME